MNERFYLIIFVSTYIFLKEHCKKISNCSADKRDQNIDKILSLIQPLEQYVHIPDKADFIHRAYDEIEAIWESEASGKEAKLLDRVKRAVENLNKREKKEILNILIYVMNEDGKISVIEKEFLLQLVSVMGLNESYKDLMKTYEQSPFRKPFPLKKMMAIAVTVIVLLFSGIYYLSTTMNKDDVRVFKKHTVMFNRLNFNRFIIYKNKYSVENSHFAKHAVFSISGIAEIGFDPKYIKYDKDSKILTYMLPKDAPFIVEVSSKVTLIDEANPVPLSESEAVKLSAGLALAGGFVGGKIGNSLGSLYPHPLLNIGATLAGGTAGALGAGLVSFKAFNGLQVSKKFTKKEKVLVVNKSKELLTAILKYDDTLTKMYAKNFKKYLKAKYAAKGLLIKEIVFSDDKLDRKVAK